MLSQHTRLAVIAAAVAYGAYALYGGDQLGWLALVAAAVLTYTQVRHGCAWLAMHACKAGRFDRAARLLAQVSRPELLAPKQRAHHERVSALVAVHSGRLGEAEAHLRRCLDIGLQSANDIALVESTLAHILVERGETQEPRQLLDAAAARDCSPAVAKAIADIRDRVGAEANARAS